MRLKKIPHDEGLSWLLGSLDQASGLSTSHPKHRVAAGNDPDGAMVRRLERIGPGSTHEHLKFQIGEGRKLYARFCALPTDVRAVLATAYSGVAWGLIASEMVPEAGNVLDRLFGEYAGVALMTRAMRDAFVADDAWKRSRKNDHSFGPFATDLGRWVLDMSRRKPRALEPARGPSYDAVTVALASWWGQPHPTGMPTLRDLLEPEERAHDCA